MSGDPAPYGDQELVVPQISLEDIVALARVKKGATKLRDQVREEYKEKIQALAKASIKRVRGWRFLPGLRGLHFWKEYDILDKSFFKIHGRYEKISNQAFNSLSYTPGFYAVRDNRSGFSEVYWKFEEVRKATIDFVAYLREQGNFMGPANPIGEQLILIDNAPLEQLTLFDNRPRGDELLGDNNIIYGHVDRIIEAVRHYNIEIENLVQSLPKFEDEEAGTPSSLGGNVCGMNSYLRDLGRRPYTRETADKALALGKTAQEILGVLEGIKLLDFSVNRWYSSNFAELAVWQGFEVVYEKKLTLHSPRPLYAVREVKDSSPE